MSIPSPSRLLKYLKDVQRDHPDILFKNKVGEMLEALAVFKSLADEVHKSMLPQRLDFALVWGTMALMVTVSNQILFVSNIASP